jgi:hypothetical protein
MMLWGALSHWGLHSHYDEELTAGTRTLGHVFRLDSLAGLSNSNARITHE